MRFALVRVPDFSRYLQPLRKRKKFDSLFEKIDRGIKTVAGVDVPTLDSKGYLQVLIFPVKDVYEFLSAVVLLFLIGAGLAVLAGTPLAFVFALLLPLYAVALYYSRVKKFERRFFEDLADIIETMLQGLTVGLPVEEVLEYAAQTKTNNFVSPFIREVVNRINAGQSLKSALEEVTYKTLSPEFARLARILSLRSETTADIAKSLKTLHENILIRAESSLMTKVEKFNVTFVLLMVAGYVLPFIVTILYPLLITIIRGGKFLP